ncbi:TatD family hydrolase [Paenibacillus agilis]|uniref:TatD family deoxyribonuclease n=1 Tax=Paenibacillus agilis TaxID=3020863 RepID=A0A559IVK5_9BACL|nr:TatD family hydrolase [Paenibacillus agilis]TVX91654.1 TatD family deoxyribonuclease [Paenibacillus agilis]
MSNFVDFHIHIDYYKNYKEMFNYFLQTKTYALFVTNLPEVFEQCKREFPESKYVKIGMGYNPQLAITHDFNRALFDNWLPHTKYIGEVGLDYSKDFIEYKIKQQKAFQHICMKSGKANKIMSIHSKRAEQDILDILKENKVRFAVFHWYSGSEHLVEEIVRRGYYFSVNYSMLSTAKGFNIITSIPLERLLIETDAPFGKSNLGGRTYNLPLIYEEFEEKLKVKNFRSIVLSNLKRLLVEQQNQL